MKLIRSITLAPAFIAQTFEALIAGNLAMRANVHSTLSTEILACFAYLILAFVALSNEYFSLKLLAAPAYLVWHYLIGHEWALRG